MNQNGAISISRFIIYSHITYDIHNRTKQNDGCKIRPIQALGMVCLVHSCQKLVLQMYDAPTDQSRSTETVSMLTVHIIYPQARAFMHIV